MKSPGLRQQWWFVPPATGPPGVRMRKEALSQTPWLPRQRGQDSRGSCSGNWCSEVTDVMVPATHWPAVTTQPHGVGGAGLPGKCWEAGTGTTWPATLVTARSRSGRPASPARPDGGLGRGIFLQATTFGLPPGPLRLGIGSGPAFAGWTRASSDRRNPKWVLQATQLILHQKF